MQNIIKSIKTSQGFVKSTGEGVVGLKALRLVKITGQTDKTVNLDYMTDTLTDICAGVLQPRNVEPDVLTLAALEAASLDAQDWLDDELAVYADQGSEVAVELDSTVGSTATINGKATCGPSGTVRDWVAGKPIVGTFRTGSTTPGATVILKVENDLTPPAGA